MQYIRQRADIDWCDRKRRWWQKTAPNSASWSILCLFLHRLHIARILFGKSPGTRINSSPSLVSLWRVTPTNEEREKRRQKFAFGKYYFNNTTRPSADGHIRLDMGFDISRLTIEMSTQERGVSRSSDKDHSRRAKERSCEESRTSRRSKKSRDL